MKTYSGPASVRRHLNRFAIATILAGVGLLVLAWPAEAEIIHTKVNVKISANSSYKLDLNNDGVTDFIISTNFAHGMGGNFSENFTETPASGNGAVGSPPARLARDQIGPSQTFYGGTGTMASLRCIGGYSCSVSGDWIRQASPYGGRGGYLGLSFQINGETHYGWAHLSVSSTDPQDPFVTLTGYAYETIPDMPTNAGQPEDAEDGSALSPSPANPDDSRPGASPTDPTQAVSVGTLALGAQEFMPWRRKESVGAAPENN